jgi:hypothetical protein
MGGQEDIEITDSIIGGMNCGRKIWSIIDSIIGGMYWGRRI